MMQLEEISYDTSLWLQKSHQKGLDIIQWYQKEIKQNITPSDLYEVFIKWVADHSDNRAPNDWIVDGLGILFGNYIIDQTRGKWVIEKDGEEKYLIVLTPNGTKLYPIDSILKRVDTMDGEMDFFSSIWHVIQEKEVIPKVD